MCKKSKLFMSTLIFTLLVSSTCVFASTIPNSPAYTHLSTSNTISQKINADSNKNIKLLKLGFNKQASAGHTQLSRIKTNLIITADTAAYTIIHTPYGDAELLRQGCTGHAVYTLQVDLNGISVQYPAVGKINLVEDSDFGPATKAAVEQFQRYIRDSWGCSSMSVDGEAGYQTWTALNALFSGDNPHSFIN